MLLTLLIITTLSSNSHRPHWRGCGIWQQNSGNYQWKFRASAGVGHYAVVHFTCSNTPKTGKSGKISIGWMWKQILWFFLMLMVPGLYYFGNPILSYIFWFEKWIDHIMLMDFRGLSAGENTRFSPFSMYLYLQGVLQSCRMKFNTYISKWGFNCPHLFLIVRLPGINGC